MDVFVIKCLNCSEELEETYKFCSRCGVAVDKEEVLIRYYFKLNISLEHELTCNYM